MADVLLSRVDAFLREFPFLSRYGIKRHQFHTNPKVQRIDLDLLDQWGWTPATGEGQWRRYILRRFIFINQYGTQVAEVRQLDKIRKKFVLWRPITWFPEYLKGETVLQALRTLPDPDLVYYIVEISDSFARRPSHDPEYGLELVIHKVPAGRTLSVWLKEINQIAAEELQRKLRDLDQV